jgi:hypothetical protein
MQDDEGEKIRTWEAQLKATTREQINKFGVTDIIDELNELRLSTNFVGPAIMTVSDTWPQGEHTSTGHDA